MADLPLILLMGLLLALLLLPLLLLSAEVPVLLVLLVALFMNPKVGSFLALCLWGPAPSSLGRLAYVVYLASELAKG